MNELEQLFDTLEAKVNSLDHDPERLAACVAHLATVRMHAMELQRTVPAPDAAPAAS